MAERGPDPREDRLPNNPFALRAGAGTAETSPDKSGPTSLVFFLKVSCFWGGTFSLQFKLFSYKKRNFYNDLAISVTLWKCGL